MKIIKRAKQKNIVVDKDAYTVQEINAMLRTHTICYFDDEFNECYNEQGLLEYDKKEYRVFTENLKSINVELNQYGYYQVYGYLKECDLLIDKIELIL